MKNTILFTLTFLISFSLLASPHGESASGIGSLWKPYLNFFLLAGFLVWKLKKPLRQYFINKADLVIQASTEAESRSKEAKIILETTQRKLKNLDTESSKIVTRSEEEAKEFEKLTKKETEARSEEIKRNAQKRLEAEKAQLVNQFNKNLLEDVIEKSKKLVMSGNEQRKSVSKKLTKEIG